MPVARLAGIPGFSIDRVAAAAGDDPTVLRLENLDTDLRPPPPTSTAGPAPAQPARRGGSTSTPYAPP